MKKKVLVSMETEKIQEMDVIRGDIPRSAYIRRIVENEIESVHGRILQDNTMNGMMQNRHEGGSANV